MNNTLTRHVLIEKGSSIGTLKKKGYHIRISGSMFVSECLTSCDCCGEKTFTKIGYEKDYPNNPDMGLCIECSNVMLS